MKIIIEAASVKELRAAIVQLLGDDPGPQSDNIDELGLTARASNCLKGEDISTISELIDKTHFDLLRIPNFGRNTLHEVKLKLAERGLALKDIKA